MGYLTSEISLRYERIIWPIERKIKVNDTYDNSKYNDRNSVIWKTVFSKNPKPINEPRKKKLSLLVSNKNMMKIELRARSSSLAINRIIDFLSVFIGIIMRKTTTKPQIAISIMVVVFDKPNIFRPIWYRLREK